MGQKPLICVFGGSGFVGRHIVKALAATGARIRVAVRRPNQAMFLLPAGNVGQIQLMAANVRDDASVAEAVKGADVVINLVGILHQSGKQRFDEVQGQGPGRIARAAKDAGVARFIQMSAIGADASSASAYARTKAQGEAAVREAFPEATILRPSIVFGPEDDFFNRFAWMASVSPFLPLVGGGKTKFQPVYVADIAKAVVHILDNRHWAGKTFELGGPEVLTFKELLEQICTITHRRRVLLPLPFPIASFQAFFLQMLPNPILTMDQVRLLKSDNVVADEGVHTFKDLAIAPTAAEVVVPSYLWAFRPHGQFDGEAATT
jgi:NADH dehydrogenase